MNICVILVAGGSKQNECFWPTYINTTEGIPYDLVIVHRNNQYIPNSIPISSNVKSLFLENKIFDWGELPYQAFGAYRYYFNKYKDNYEYFIFISDDVLLRRNDWLKDVIDGLNQHSMLGFGGSQIFNGHKAYPHETHIRSPFWFAKTECLSKIDWQFESDHHGEMLIGEQLTKTGYFGIQIGNKINLAYDSYEKDHITQLLENKYFPSKNLIEPFISEEYNFFKDLYDNLSENTIKEYYIKSPWDHIPTQNVFIDIEPFHNLIYLSSLETAKKYMNVKNLGNGVYTI